MNECVSSRECTSATIRYDGDMDLSGIYPPLPTPFSPDGSLDLAGLAANLKSLADEPLAGFVLGGSNGEFSSLTLDERVEVVRAARQHLGPGRCVIAGAGLESTAATIALTRRMAEAGADAALVVTPGYFRSRMTTPALDAHFRSVADASPLPVILYSVPANTGVDLPVEAVVSLSSHPNILGLKDSGGDITKFGRMALECRPGFQLLAGSAGFLLPALAIGAVGGIMALANIAPRQLRRVLDAFQARDLPGARAAQLPLILANTAVTTRYGVAGLKAALDLLGRVGGLPRPPLLPLVPAERRDLVDILSRAGLLSPSAPHANEP